VPGVPAFILRRLYVKGSLHNRDDGWGFKLKNTLGSGYAKGLIPVTVDGTEIALDHSFFDNEGAETSFTAVTDENTFSLKLNRDILLYFRGDQLEAGERKIGLGFIVPGLGTLKFDFNDEVAPADASA
jgi:hypothetical protein